MRIHDWRHSLLLLIAAGAVVALLLIGRVPQDPAYHQFADHRTIGGIAHFWNVVSNLPFLGAGLFGLWRAPRLRERGMRSAYRVLCVGVLLVGLGSTWYHLAPSNATLLWDRLPMTVAFMALFTLLLEERVLGVRRPWLLWSPVAFGAASAFGWAWTESLGRGDLRPYILVQFLPMLLMPLILILYRSRVLRDAMLWTAFALYVAAKLLETCDSEIWMASGGLGGHALKHLAAAVAVFGLIVAMPVSARDRDDA